MKMHPGKCTHSSLQNFIKKDYIFQGSKLTGKSHLPPVENVGSIKLLPGNSVMKLIS